MTVTHHAIDSAPGPDAEVALLEQDLAAGSASRLAKVTGRAAIVVRALALAIMATGAAALVIGLAAWRDEPIGVLVVVVVCLPAVGLPIYVARRARALGEAAGHPREMAAQAQDLVSRVRHSAELRTLADRLAGGRARGPSGRRPRTGRLRGALSLARLASTVIGQAAPDDDRHGLLVPFTPERLTRTWAAVIWSLWAGLAAAVVLAVSVPALLFSIL